MASAQAIGELQHRRIRSQHVDPSLFECAYRDRLRRQRCDLLQKLRPRQSASLMPSEIDTAGDVLQGSNRCAVLAQQTEQTIRL
jgi:hypothetical protein